MNAEQYWTNQITGSSQYGNPKPQPGTEEFEKLRLQAWAEYYRRQQQQQQRAAAAVNLATTSTTTTTARTTAPAKVPKPVTQVPQTKKEEGYPDGLKRYVQRCMSVASSHNNVKLSEWVSGHVEKVIANALRTGNLWSFNWDSLPTVTPPSFLLNENKSYASAVVGAVQVSSSSRSVIGPSSEFSVSSSTKSVAPGKVQSQKRGLSSMVEEDKARYSNMKGDDNCGTSSKSYSYYGSNKFARTLSDSSSSHSNATNNHNNNQHRNAFDASVDFVSFSSSSPNNKQKKKTKKAKKKGLASSKKMDAGSAGFESSSKMLAARANRFNNTVMKRDKQSSEQVKSDFGRYMGLSVIGGDKDELHESDFEKMTVKGKCQVLEKEYLRLTSPPKEEDVRPQEILEQHLKNLKWL